MSNSRVDSGAFCEICINCKERLPGNQWCQQCETTSFKSAFKSWTSGNHDLDKFIRKTQSKAIDRADYLEWIPYERIENINFISYGAYGSVSYGTWLDGPRWNWNDDSKSWERTGPKEVALKTINNSQNLSPNFFNELKPFFNCSIEGNRLVHCYGISRDPQTKNFIAVIEYANNGSLINYISKNFKTLTWDKKLSILSDIIQGLKNIHEANIVHKDLHAGNILVHSGDKIDKDYAAISDIGLCHFVSKGFKLQSPNVVYGVIPYIAPEVLQGRPYTKASDIYSTGVLMWAISSGKQPFSDRGHDFQLQIDICNGIRPDITPDTPQFYQDLMESCWNQDPKQRPTIQTIQLDLKDFIKGSGGARKQIEEAEKIRLELQSGQLIITNPPNTHKAYYTTREIKVIHVSPTKLNLEIYNFKPKLSKKLKLSVKKPEQTLAMSKERIHFQMDFNNVNNKQNFDTLCDLNQATPIVPLPDTFNNTSLNLELTDYTKKSKKIKKEIALEKSASKYYRSDCRCSIM